MICYYCRQNIGHKEKMLEGLHEHCFSSWFALETPQPFVNIVARQTESADEKFAQVTNSFFHGKFRKYSANLKNQQFILKVQQAELPELPATEFLCNQIAKLLGLDVPNFHMVRLENKLDTFVVDNFMQVYPTGNLIHIYRFFQSPKQFTCQGLLAVIEKIVGRQVDLDRFVKLCLFDALIGNHDRHGRNLAIIESPQGSVLSPFYDNPSYLGMEIPELLGAHHEPRGAIPTAETREPTMKDYVLEFQRLGYDKVIASFEKVVKIDKIEQLINESFICAARQSALLRLVKRRHKELVDVIK